MINPSTLERNQQLINNRFLEKTKFIDVDYRGFIDEDTQPDLSRAEALINSVKVWLISKGGDYYHDLTKGGVLPILLNTPLNSNRAEEIKSLIQEKFSVNFDLLQLQDLIVIPNLERRIWTLSFKIKDLLNNELISFGTSIQATV